MAFNPDYFLRVNIKSVFGLLFLFSILNSSCAYRIGYGDRALPGGYTEVAIPIFENLSNEVGIEVDFTNSLIEQFNRSRVALVEGKDRSPIVVQGTISTIDISRGLGASTIGRLPRPAVLSTEYRLTVNASVQILRQSDQKVLWTGAFSKSMVYLAPRIGTPVVNSANATYNASKRRETLRLIAQEMMLEAHDRMTESF